MYTKRGRHFNYFTGISKSIFKKAHFKFVEARKYTYVISIIVLLAGVSTYWTGFDKGVEFSGGRSYKIRFDKAHNIEDVKTKLNKYFGGNTLVKTIGTDNTLDITTSYLITTPGQDIDKKVEEKLFEGLVTEQLLPASTTFELFKRNYLQQSTTVLPTISDDLKAGAVKATIISLIAIFLYILIRFRKWQYSLGALAAVLHDVIFVLGIYSLLYKYMPFHMEMDQHFIAAILTVIGYSMNDTVIVFDRIREFLAGDRKGNFKDVVNASINTTLSRTLNTSLTMILVLLIMFIFGGDSIRGFIFAMLIGIIVGTYSSLFIATPVLVDTMSKKAIEDIEKRHGN
jgi:SecD/SecF fusion protein